MNKQEAINELKKYNLGFGEAVTVRFERAVSIINKIDEPQKVVVPKYISDKIEYCKNTGDYDLFHAMNYCYQYKDSAEWLECNQETFVRAWLDGFEIEQEKLYTVEIPNPNKIGNEVNVLMMNGFRQVVIKKDYGNDWKKQKGFQLTEEEIKRDFEWAWQWAKPVEVEV